MNSFELNHYNEAKVIALNVYTFIKNEIEVEQVLETNILMKKGNEKILEYTNKIYKKEKNKGIAFPVCISLNNCVGFNVSNDIIKKGDIIKIEFGVSVCGKIYYIGETIIYESKNKEFNKIIKFLNEAHTKIIDKVVSGTTNDDLRLYIEPKCTKLNIFPIKNCISWQQFDSLVKSDNSKYVIFNYNKEYDIEDNLVMFNDCYDFEAGEVYNINLTVTLQEPMENKERQIKPAMVYRFNDNSYSLKLKNSRNFYNKISSLHLNYAFDIKEHLQDPKNKVGIKECIEKNLLETYPIVFEKEVVFFKKFTIIIK